MAHQGNQSARKHQARVRERRAWELRQEGKTQDEIAKELGVAQPTVSLILSRVNRRVLAELTEDVKAHKVALTADLKRVVNHALLAYERSQRNSNKVVREVVTQGQSETVTETRATGQRDGEVAYLAEAHKALLSIAKIWGMEPPKERPDDAGAPLFGLEESQAQPRPTPPAPSEIAATSAGSGDLDAPPS